MERRIFKTKRRITSKNIFIAFLLSAVCALPVFSQNVDFTERIHLPLWAEIDAEPGLSELATENNTEMAETSQKDNSEAGTPQTTDSQTESSQAKGKKDQMDENYAFAISRLHQTGPYLLNGMVYGWTFCYVPYDKTRGVQEYFEVTPINTIKPSDGKITYAKPWIQDNLLYCWVEFTRTPQMIWNLKAWSAITSKKAHGKGYGKSRDGFKGIQDAAEDALKEALRSYYREILKNKPKEIDGKVIIRNTPKIGLKAGQYIVELDFFLETDKIVKYTQF